MTGEGRSLITAVLRGSLTETAQTVPPQILISISAFMRALQKVFHHLCGLRPGNPKQRTIVWTSWPRFFLECGDRQVCLMLLMFWTIIPFTLIRTPPNGAKGADT